MLGTPMLTETYTREDNGRAGANGPLLNARFEIRRTSVVSIFTLSPWLPAFGPSHG
jgi:hypothetical protein